MDCPICATCPHDECPDECPPEQRQMMADEEAERQDPTFSERQHFKRMEGHPSPLFW